MIKANRWTIFPPYMFKWNGSRFLKKKAVATNWAAIYNFMIFCYVSVSCGSSPSLAPLLMGTSFLCKVCGCPLA